MDKWDWAALPNLLPIPSLNRGDRSVWVQRLDMAWKSTSGREGPGQSLFNYSSPV